MILIIEKRDWESRRVIENRWAWSRNEECDQELRIEGKLWWWKKLNKREEGTRNEIVKRETRSRSEIKFALNPFVGWIANFIVRIRQQKAKFHSISNHVPNFIYALEKGPSVRKPQKYSGCVSSPCTLFFF